jgi:pyruvate formate lyase activating enzyme
MLLVHSYETFGVHDGPGIRLVLFLQGCLFRCVYCSNPDTQPLKNSHAKKMPDKEILDLLEKERPYFKDSGGLTISGGEPTVQTKDLIKLFKKVKKKGFHTAIDTCGGIFSPDVNKLYDLTDIVMLDVKHIDPDHHKKVTGAKIDNVLKNAAYREETGKDMWLKYVLVPGLTDQPEYLEKWAKTFKDYKSVTKVEILPYHVLGVHKYKEMGKKYTLSKVAPISREQCEKAKKIFDKYLKNVIIK